jgi:peptidoglycan/LPS O-acetylase OafA/YrhL
LIKRRPDLCHCYLKTGNFMPNTLRNLFLLCALGWAGVIFYLSSLPGVDIPPLFFGNDKLLHALVFGILGFFIPGAMKTTPDGYRPFQPWLVVIVVTVYGVLDEFHQHFVPGRSPDIYDVMSDAAGGMLGVWLFYRLVMTRLRIPA